MINYYFSKKVFAAPQPQGISGTANTANKTGFLDNVHVEHYVVEIKAIRYPRDATDVEYAKFGFVSHKTDLKLFHKENVGKTFLNSLSTYPDMKNFSPIEVFDSKIQVDQINLKKIQLFEKDRGAPHNAHIDAGLLPFLIKLRELKLISEFRMDITLLKFKIYKLIPKLKEFIKQYFLRNITWT